MYEATASIELLASEMFRLPYIGEAHFIINFLACSVTNLVSNIDLIFNLKSQVGSIGCLIQTVLHSDAY